MPFPPPKQPVRAASLSEAKSYLTGKPAASPAQQSESADMGDEVYQQVHALVAKLGVQAIRDALDKCEAEEQSEQPGDDVGGETSEME